MCISISLRPSMNLLFIVSESSANFTDGRAIHRAIWATLSPAHFPLPPLSATELVFFCFVIEVFLCFAYWSVVAVVVSRRCGWLYLFIYFKQKIDVIIKRPETCTCERLTLTSIARRCCITESSVCLLFDDKRIDE